MGLAGLAGEAGAAGEADGVVLEAGAGLASPPVEAPLSLLALFL